MNVVTGEVCDKYVFLRGSVGFPFTTVADPLFFSNFFQVSSQNIFIHEIWFTNFPQQVYLET